jgi:hypothetical protein
MQRCASNNVCAVGCEIMRRRVWPGFVHELVVPTQR